MRVKFRFWLMLVLIILVVFPAGWFLFHRLEGKAPSVSMMPSLVTIGESQTVKLIFSDPETGIRRIRIGLSKDGKEKVLYEKEFDMADSRERSEVNEHTVDLMIESDKLGFADGRALLIIDVNDHSWRGWLKGNRTYVEKPVMIDSRPPEIDVLTRMHNINQGGSGMVVYRISEACPENGVMVGGHFFPGHPGYFDDAGIHIAFFALNYSQGPGTVIFITATDRAGNTARAGFPHYIRRKNFRRDILSVSDRFLDWKMPEFKVETSDKKPMKNLEKYLFVNRDQRKADYEALARMCAETEKTLYWKGPFLRLPNSARRAGFADHREYRYKGKTVDHQVHMGIDLASVRQADVPASNAGKVVFAGPLGIYGKSVLIDHGYGLFSMYSHLSRVKVESGKVVSSGDVVGNTGTTGLAAGDHLHLGMLIHDTFVNPIEWWDAAWIKNNITSKIEDVRNSVHN